MRPSEQSQPSTLPVFLPEREGPISADAQHRWQHRLGLFIDAAKATDLSTVSSCLRKSYRLGSDLEQRHLLKAMLHRPESHIQALSFILHHESTGDEPLRADASVSQVKSRLAGFPMDFRSGPLLRQLFDSTPPHFKADLFCLASTSCDSEAASLVLDELNGNGLHAELCARALLAESIDTQTASGPRRAFNALVLAAALASPACGQHRDLLIAVIIQLCAPLKHGTSRQTLLRALEGTSSVVRREFDRLIMASSERRVRERLIPMLSIPPLKRPARASLESCSPGIIDAACSHAGHRIGVAGRLSLLGHSAIALQFISALKSLASYREESSSVLAACLSEMALDDRELLSALQLCMHSDSPVLKWKGEMGMLRRFPRRLSTDGLGTHCSPGHEDDPHFSSRPGTVDDLQEFGAELAHRPDWWLGARAKILIDRHPDAFLALIRRYLTEEPSTVLLPLLRLIRRCRLGPQLEAEVLGLAESGRHDLTGEHRRELVHILASTESSRGASYILRSTVDADARVQQAVLSILATPDSNSLGGGIMVPDLLKRIACTADSGVRKAALKALRARSRSSFEELMDTLFGGESDESPSLLLDAALYSGRPVVSRVLRLLERTEDKACSLAGSSVLRTLHAQKGPWITCTPEQVAV